MLVAVLTGFVGAFAAPFVARIGKMRGWLIALLPLALTIYFISFATPITSGQVFEVAYSWVPSLGIDLAFYLDGLSWLFTLLIGGIGTFVFIYAGAYLGNDPLIGRFYAYILIFMASMLGLVLANNLLTLFIFWELTSFSSYLLIGYKHEDEGARKAALRALLVTGGGGLSLMAGLILLGIAGNTYEISTLLAAEGIAQHPLYVPILLLILLGAFTKSAQVPFHFWLPGAMSAPAPVSAYLHSATMVKAGVYLLARFSPILGDTQLWQVILLVVGGLTMLVGAYLALQQTDLKRILAYSTISSLGTLFFLLGIDTHLASEAVIIYLIVHSLYKGALFLIAGIIEHETGTRDVTALGGLYRLMPFTALAAGLAALSMAGIPPLLGFIGKELLYETTLDAYDFALVLTAVALIVNIIQTAIAAIVFIRPFTGQHVETPHHPHRVPIGLWLGPLILGILGLAAGILLYPFGQLISPAVSALEAEPTTVKLALWHGINPMLLLSIVTIAGGLILYRWRDTYRRQTARFSGDLLSPARWYDRGLDSLLAFAHWQTSVLQHGYLRFYVLSISLVFAVLVGITLIFRSSAEGTLTFSGIQFHEAVIAAIIAIAIIIVIRARSRLAAVIALGVIGYGVSLIFLLYGAPDLAMTQFAIETLTVILMVLVLYRLPPFSHFTSTRRRQGDAITALIIGMLITILVLVVISDTPKPSLSPFFATNSLTEAKGRNIVNVILVDFRGLDTLGEISVLAIAAFGVLSLLRLRTPPSKPKDEGAPPSGEKTGVP